MFSHSGRGFGRLAAGVASPGPILTRYVLAAYSLVPEPGGLPSGRAGRPAEPSRSRRPGWCPAWRRVPLHRYS